MDQWFGLSTELLKRDHIAAAIAGRGGVDKMTARDWGRIGGTLRREYGFLRNLADEIAGQTVSIAKARARLMQYASAIQQSYWSAQRETAIEAGKTEERRLLNPGETCADCVGYSDQGWVAIGTLPPPGAGSVCGSNCNCSYEQR